MKLRVWYIQNPPGDTEYFRVESVEEAIKKINVLTNCDLRDPFVTCNMMGLEAFYYGFGGWVEYYDDAGRDIDGIIILKENKKWLN